MAQPVTGVDDLEQTFELLLSGRIDATLNAEVTYYDYMKAHPDAEIKIACLDPESTKVGIPMKKGDETKTLLEAVNKALGELAEDGTLTELSGKIFWNGYLQRSSRIRYKIKKVTDHDCKLPYPYMAVPPCRTERSGSMWSARLRAALKFSVFPTIRLIRSRTATIPACGCGSIRWKAM